MAQRQDHIAIASRICVGARVLDVGSGQGELLDLLRQNKQVDGRGLERDSAAAGAALAKGLSVIQGDAETDLEIFPSDSFDIAVLSKTIQEIRRPAYVLSELRRIAPQVIVSFHNFGTLAHRILFLMRGRIPARGAWHNESILHPCTCADMVQLGDEVGLSVAAAAAVSNGRVAPFKEQGLTGLNRSAEEVILHFVRR